MVKKAQRLRDKAARRLGIGVGVGAGFGEQREERQPSSNSATAAAAAATSAKNSTENLNKKPPAPRHVVKVVKKLRFLKRAAASAPLPQRHEQKGSLLGVARNKRGSGGVGVSKKKTSTTTKKQQQRRRRRSSSSSTLGDFSSLVASLSDPEAFAPKKVVALASLSTGKERMRAAEVAQKGGFFSLKRGGPLGLGGGDPFAAVAAAVASSVGGGAGESVPSAPSAAASRWQGIDPAKAEQQRKRMRREAKERRKAAKAAGGARMSE